VLFTFDKVRIYLSLLNIK